MHQPHEYNKSLAQHAAEAAAKEEQGRAEFYNKLTQPNTNSRQVGGDHYLTGGQQHWDFAAALYLDYFQGQITKYVVRWRNKGGIEDLLKAQHFLQKYIEVNSKNTLRPPRPPATQNLSDVETNHAEPGPGYVDQD